MFLAQKGKGRQCGNTGCDGGRLCLLDGRLWRLLLLHYPAERLLGDKSQRQQVVPAKRIGGFPFLAFAIAALERGVKKRSLVGVVFPDGGMNPVQADYAEVQLA